MLRRLCTIGVVLVVATVLAACGGSSSDQTTSEDVATCGSTPDGPRTTLTYEVEGSTSGDDVERTAETICQRLEALNTVGEVTATGERVTLVLPSTAARDVAPVAAAEHLINFYALEPNVVPLEKNVAPGAVTPENLEAQSTTDLHDAVELASKQPPEPCDEGELCSTRDPRFYLFDQRTYVAGPVATERWATDIADVAGVPQADRAILEVPVGTIVVQDQPDGGASGGNAAPRYLVLSDHPALNGADVIGPEQAVDPVTNEPGVTFQLTEDGQAAFGDVTGDIAQQGAETGSPHSLAIVFDDEIASRPIIDPAQNPDGIDGSEGVQVAGGFTAAEAENLANVLAAGSLPVYLRLAEVEEEKPAA